MSKGSKGAPFLSKLKRRLGGRETGAERELFLCTGPDCCRREVGLAAWKHLQHRIHKEGLTACVSVKRTACMNICGEGPIAVVYPERTFYAKMDEAGLDAVIDDDLKAGKRAEPYAFEPPDDVQEPPHRKLPER